MIEQKLAIKNNLKRFSNGNILYMTSTAASNSIIKSNSDNSKKLSRYNLKKNHIITGFDIIENINAMPVTVVVITGMSFLIVLDEDLKEKYFELSSDYIDDSRYLDNKFCFNGITKWNQKIFIGTLTCELLCLNFYFDVKHNKPSFKLEGIMKFKESNCSINDLFILPSFEKNNSIHNLEMIVALSNSKILKIKFDKNEKKPQIISSFKFNNIFTTAILLTVVDYEIGNVILTANIDGSISMLDYDTLHPLQCFTLFSKSIQSMSTYKLKSQNWEVLLTSNDGYCNKIKF